MTAGRTLPVVLVTGPPATGKSTLGRLLAGSLQAALIDQDVATEPLMDVVKALVSIDDLDHPRLGALTRTARYEVLAALAIDNLAAGVPVVLVAPYTAERSDPRVWTELSWRLAAAGGTPLLVWLSLTAEAILQRLQDRGATRDQAKLADRAAYLERLQSLTAAPCVPHLALSADLPSPALLRRVLEAVN